MVDLKFLSSLTHMYIINNIITPRACARGKVIGFVVVVSKKIAISRDVGV